MKRIVLGLLVLSLAGCGEQFMPKPKSEEKPKSATKKAETKEERTGGVIDDVLLQRSKFDALKKTRNRLDKINADREKQIKEMEL